MEHTILLYILGPLFGFVVGYLYAGIGSNKVATPFTADHEEADDLRREANAAIQSRIGRRKRRILARAETAGKITNDQVEDMFCISDRTAGRYLREMVEDRQLKKVGTTGPGVHYVPARSNQDG